MVAQVSVLDPQKLVGARGRRTLREIVEASGGKFSVQQLNAYEHGHYRPKPELVPYLLDALGVEFDDVSSVLTIAAPVASRTTRSRASGATARK